MTKMQQTMEAIRQKVFSESVQMSDFTPPWKEYSQIRATVSTTFMAKGMPRASNTKFCNTTHTTKKRTDAPSIFDTKKNHAPVR